MKKEHKELLLKDLCARLPYGIKAQYYDEEEQCETYDIIESVTVDTSNPTIDIGQYTLHIDKVKPYLFSISNMTEKQEIEFKNTCNNYCEYYWTEETIDWLNKNHFDYRGLIEKGLAIDATDKNIY